MVITLGQKKENLKEKDNNSILVEFSLAEDSFSSIKIKKIDGLNRMLSNNKTQTPAPEKK